MNHVGFTVVGLGMGRKRAALIQKTSGAKLISVVDLNPQHAQSVGEELGCDWYTSLTEALQNDHLDVVVVFTPSGLHAETSIEALESGRHVITTKPMEVTLEKCDAMIAAADRADRILCVDHDLRYGDGPQKIKYALDHGLFGQPILGEARLKWHRSQSYYDASRWRGTWEIDGGGALANQTIHNIDLLVWFMGAAKNVTGRIGTFNHQIETEDLGMAMVEFVSGAHGTILGTTTWPENHTDWAMEIHGTEGGVVLAHNGEARWIFPNRLAHREKKLQHICPSRNVFEDMVCAVREGTAPLCDAREGRLSIELLTAIYDSANHGGFPVNLGAS